MKPKLVKGTRDFFNKTVKNRNYIFQTLRMVFEKYGFQPLETPALEELSTLTGKYGEEGDQLLFKIINNGDYLSRSDKAALEALDSSKLLKSISKRALRYDLTVPLARFVVMNRNELLMPYRRYQIQPVWRADNPQKGRYREFFQCDVDIIGSPELLHEAELCQIYDEAFQKLGLKVIIRLNNRKILEGMAEICNAKDQFSTITILLDKLDKIGWEKVSEGLSNMGLTQNNIALIDQIINADKIETLIPLLKDSETGMEGLQELEKVMEYLKHYTFSNLFKLDFKLARGLSYYTGCIFEVEVDTTAPGQENIKMGSIGGGGRYANLTEIFGQSDMPGVGISFGADRIYDVLEELNLFYNVPNAPADVIIMVTEEQYLNFAFDTLTQLRKNNIAALLHPKAMNFNKLFKYANKTEIKHLIIIGSEEFENKKLTLKNMISGEQHNGGLQEILKIIEI